MAKRTIEVDDDNVVVELPHHEWSEIMRCLRAAQLIHHTSTRREIIDRLTSAEWDQGGNWQKWSQWR